MLSGALEKDLQDSREREVDFSFLSSIQLISGGLMIHPKTKVSDIINEYIVGAIDL